MYEYVPKGRTRGVRGEGFVSARSEAFFQVVLLVSVCPSINAPNSFLSE